MPMTRFQGRPMTVLGLGMLMMAPLGYGAGAGPAEAASFSKAGIWDMVEDNAHRQCRMVLRSDAAEAGLAIGMPPGCRHAFPVLAKVAIWVDAGDSVLRLEDAAGQPVLNFELAGDAFTATGPEGDVFKLQPIEPARRAALAKAAAEAASADAAAGAIVVAGGTGPAAAPVKRVLPVKINPIGATAAELAGHYAVLRDRTHDTGCMVTLDEKVPGPKAMLKARLAPACRDQGIIIFDPVGWAIEGGRLVLMARKGHTTHLDPQDDGSWMKDPGEGKSLSLKKM